MSAPPVPAAPLPGSVPLLETRDLCRNFGALAVARHINFRLEEGARHALIGPNGAGKTTFINLLTGVLQPTSGQVLLKGRPITGAAQAERVKLGIARTFQINRLFRGLSVLGTCTSRSPSARGSPPPCSARRAAVERLWTSRCICWRR